MKLSKSIQLFFVIGTLVATVVVFGGCFGGYNMMGLHLFSMTIEVRGQNNVPMIGAVVRCSTGEAVTVDSTGIVKLNFSDVGVYHVTVTYRDNIIASYNVSMPSDGGKTLTANYVPPAAPPAGETTTAPTGNNAFEMMGARLYPVLFQYVFNAYGYNMDLTAYNPGQFTEWQISSGGKKEFTTRKAFLTKLPTGQEWWQVTFVSHDKDSMMMEVLFSDQHQSMRRMRQKFGNEAPKEVPVTEGWYTTPMQLTPESIEGSVVKKGVGVTVPAGNYTCDQLEFGVAPGMTLRMYRAADVPGGVVKYEMVDKDGKSLYAGELNAAGSGAATQLGSY